MASLDAHVVSHPSAPMRAEDQKRVRKWLMGLAALTALIVIVGGATRLTESGLSITEWDVMTGVLPPLDERQWVAEFDKYRATPQYLQMNVGMTLSQFQVIYGWEWVHRLVGRLIGVVFIIGFLFFLATRQMTRSLGAKLFGVGLLIGLQGAIGWWMVQSGLVDRVTVAPYRLATHLTLACLIFSLLIWLARDLDEAPEPRVRVPEHAAAWSGALLALIFVQLFVGALVAGNRAGYVYQTWPLMDSTLVPPGLLFLTPWWRNFFENQEMVQFTHRTIAYVLLALALWHAIDIRKRAGTGLVAMRATLLAGAVTIQAVLGISALLTGMNVAAALAHQAGILIVLTFALRHRYAIVHGACGMMESHPAA